MISRNVYGTSLAMGVVSLLMLEKLDFAVECLEDEVVAIFIRPSLIEKLDSIIKRIGDA